MSEADQSCCSRLGLRCSPCFWTPRSGSIPAGKLADRVGRKKMFLTAIVIFTTGSVLCGLAPNVATLIAAEMLEAVGAAILVPSSLALVLQSFPRDKIPAAVAVWGAIGAAAGAFGPTLGALIVSNLGWRWAFYLNVPVGLVSFLVGRAALPEGRQTNPGRLPDLASVGLLAVGVASITFGIVETNTAGWASLRFVSPAVAGIVLLSLFIARSRKIRNPVVSLDLFRANNFRWANLGMTVHAMGTSAMFLSNILFLTRVWHYSILRAGLAVSVGPAIVAVTGARFGKLAGRIGQRALLIPGGFLTAAGGLHLLVRASSAPAYLSVYLPTMVLMAFGVSLCLPQLSSAAVQSLPPDHFASGSAVGQAVRNFGATLGVAMAIALLGAAKGPHGHHLLPSPLVSARHPRTRRLSPIQPPRTRHAMSRRARFRPLKQQPKVRVKPALRLKRSPVSTQTKGTS